MEETNNDLLKQIRDASGGGGGSTTASNGLTKTGDDIALGGELTDITNITTGGLGYNLLTAPLSDYGTAILAGYYMGASDAAMIAVTDDAQISHSIAASTANITLSATNTDNTNQFVMTGSSTQLYLFSPDGTKYQLVVANGGVLSTTPA